MESMSRTATVTTRGGDVTIAVSAATDVGLVRTVNEDSFHAGGAAFIVADGMGGHAFGDRASQTLAGAFRAIEADKVTTPERVIEIVGEANDAIQALVAASDNPNSIAGTTLAGVALVDYENEGEIGSYWMVVNVGDSRVYAWDGSDVHQITVDHSAVQELVTLGLITEEQALTHRDRNVITRAVGSDEEVSCDVWLVPVVGRQMFVICSDGLTKELSDAQIAQVLRASKPGDQANDLVRGALEGGGRDNVTVVVVDSELAGEDPNPSEMPADTSSVREVDGDHADIDTHPRSPR